MKDTFFNIMVFKSFMFKNTKRQKKNKTYRKFVIDYMNRFFFVYNGSKPEFIEIEYSKYNTIIGIKERRTKRAFLDTFESISKFIVYWVCSKKRKTYRRIVFYPSLSYENKYNYNLFKGLKVENENNITSYTDYDISYVQPYLDHVLKYYCNNDQECFDYFDNWYCNIFQNTMKKNKTCIVLKSNKHGVGKGLIVNELIGQNIIGDNCYLQVGHVDEIVGHFNSHLANKILVNIDEGCTTAAENNKMKVKISENKFMMESKGLDKIVLDNFINFIITSNNDYCVYIETSDRRYFVLNCNDSIAQNTEYFNSFSQYCNDKLTALNLYKYFMSKDISHFNPSIIPMTKEKQKYLENVIPYSIQFLQEEFIPKYIINPSDTEYVQKHQKDKWLRGRRQHIIDLYQEYNKYREVHSIAQNMSSRKLSQQIQKCTQTNIKQLKINNVNRYGFVFDENIQDLINKLKSQQLWTEIEQDMTDF